MAEKMNETERYYREAINDPYKCMETVKKAPWSIRYAKEQTLELQLDEKPMHRKIMREEV